MIYFKIFRHDHPVVTYYELRKKADVSFTEADFLVFFRTDNSKVDTAFLRRVNSNILNS